MSYRIGIDLDNTILYYEELFHSLALRESWIDAGCPLDKDSIKDDLTRKCGDEYLGDQRWQQIQAWAYGQEIDRAETFEGFPDFVREARGRGDALFIVSHKTEVSNFDPAVNLRRRALDALDRRGFFRSLDEGGLGFSRGEMFFASSIEEKIAKIAELDLTHFIDDLLKVLTHPEFPKRISRLYFSPSVNDAREGLERFGNWREIARRFYLSDWFESVFSVKANVLEPLRVSGNNRLYKAETEKGDSCVIKLYLTAEGDSRPRLDAEFDHLSALSELGFRNTPQPLRKGENCAAYSFIEGVPVESVGTAEMAQVVSFLTDLGRAREGLRGFPIRPASDSRRCLKDYLDIIERRWNRIAADGAKTGWGKPAVEFLQDKVLPVKKFIFARFDEYVRQEKLDITRRLEPEEQFFSPSDFGFHNVLADKEGKLFFLDFEYSGWDDPAKLIADFFHHAGQKVSWEYKWFLLDEFAARRKNDPGFLRRWSAVIDLIGLEWTLIVLNVADPREMRRKRFANPALDAATLIDSRLEKARAMTKDMRERMDRGGRWVTIPPRNLVAANCK